VGSLYIFILINIGESVIGGVDLWKDLKLNLKALNLTRFSCGKALQKLQGNQHGFGIEI
jgi:hypothetical protein